MDFMKLFGTVIAVFLYPGCASKTNDHQICRRGTERPCYRVSYVHDSRRRLTYEEASRACRSDGGELLSMETESEQRLVERFIQKLQPGAGDYWIGLRRNPAGAGGPACPLQYYWLDGSRAKFRNWHRDEPSCGGEMCVVLYHQPGAAPDERGRFLFQWNDDNCDSRNNYVCKYALAEKPPAFTERGKAVLPVPSLKPMVLSTTESDEKLKIVLPKPSGAVSLSDNVLYVYTLCTAGPVLLLLLLLATGFLCYRRAAKRRKSAPPGGPGGPADPCVTQGPYAFSDVTKLHPPAPACNTLADLRRMYFHAAAAADQGDDYENLPSAAREPGFVTNDIYETCRRPARPAAPRAGWVDNEIYG